MQEALCTRRSCVRERHVDTRSGGNLQVRTAARRILATANLAIRALWSTVIRLASKMPGRLIGFTQFTHGGFAAPAHS